MYALKYYTNAFDLVIYTGNRYSRIINECVYIKTIRNHFTIDYMSSFGILYYR